MAGNRDDVIVLKEGEQTYGKIKDKIKEHEEPPRKGDFDLSSERDARDAQAFEKEIDLEAITEGERAEAQRHLNEEASADINGYKERARAALKQKQKDEGTLADNRSLASNYDLLTVGLTQLLHKEIEEERRHFEQSQYTLLRRLGEFFGVYRQRTIDDKTLLDSALEKKIGDIKRNEQRFRVISEQAKKDYELKKAELGKVDAGRNRCSDIYDEGETKRRKLEEQITANVKARDEYLARKSAPEYNGEVDALLRSTVETVDHLGQELRDLNDFQSDLRHEVADYVRKTAFYEGRAEKARVNYDIAGRSLGQARIMSEMMRELQGEAKDGGMPGRMLHDAVMEGQKLMEGCKGVLTESNRFFEQFVAICREYLDASNGAESLMGGNGEYGLYHRALTRLEEAAVEKAKAMRIGLHTTTI